MNRRSLTVHFSGLRWQCQFGKRRSARISQLPDGLPAEQGVHLENHRPKGLPGGAQVSIV